MAEQEHRSTGRGFGRVLVFVYGVFALAATGRSSYQLISKASEAPVPYALSAVAAVIYIVATFALATDRRRPGPGRRRDRAGRGARRRA